MLAMDQMTVCNVKGVAYSDKPTKYLHLATVKMLNRSSSSQEELELFVIFQHIFLVFSSL